MRRDLIVQETNAIGTAYLRLDLLPTGEQPAMRERFRRYLDARIEGYRKLPDIQAARAALAGHGLARRDLDAGGRRRPRQADRPTPSNCCCPRSTR